MEDSQGGTSPFRDMVRFLARDMHAKVAFICEVVGRERDRARTLALSVDGEFLENLEYKLAGTPCEGVYDEGGVSHHPNDVARLYPKDTLLADWKVESYLGMPFYDTRGTLLGHIGVMGGEPMRDKTEFQSMLSVFAARAAEALERERAS